MRKATISFLAGIVMATTGSVYAEDIKSLVGMTKKIQAEVSVKVDGKTADRPGIIIDGTTYLPVRSIGNALDMDVSYSKTEVELTSKRGIEMGPTTEASSERTQITPEDELTIRNSEEQITKALARIEENKSRVSKLEENKNSEEEKLRETGDKYERQLIEMSISAINAEIEGAEFLIKTDEEALVDLRAYIDKIKAKYDQ